MGFEHPNEPWIMGYHKVMGFLLPTESADGQKPWVITEYGLLELWVKTELTVSHLLYSKLALLLSNLGLKYTND